MKMRQRVACSDCFQNGVSGVESGFICFSNFSCFWFISLLKFSFCRDCSVPRCCSSFNCSRAEAELNYHFTIIYLLYTVVTALSSELYVMCIADILLV